MKQLADELNAATREAVAQGYEVSIHTRPNYPFGIAFGSIWWTVEPTIKRQL